MSDEISISFPSVPTTIVGESNMQQQHDSRPALEAQPHDPSPEESRIKPHFIFIEPKWSHETRETLIKAWNRAIARYYPNREAVSPFTVIEGRLGNIEPAQIQCDCMVSPANSYGIMDGGYDYVLSDVFRQPKTRDFWHISNHVQSYLQTQYRGYLPPGSCIIVPLPEDVSGPTRFVLDPEGRDQDADGNPGINYGNPWGATSMAVLPTMREPANVEWHQDLVYNCMWTLQVEIDKWNAALDDGDQKVIRKVLMTGLATGCGQVPAEKCASQMVLSVKHFNEPVLVQPRWSDVGERGQLIEDTIVGEGNPRTRYG
ncbi:SubName: Full=Uncharacterized protein {ECO:0000313/EMBL:CCA69691.1} [Serendipita indica DSM 11827]|uniref:Macro-like domain-containing protein n=1 Tax=Serendipita indica (strain DSM 11827) TaxID=1109443 RepID=G4TEE8_SERID|nr:SubName: Full=Uncharacterized protein {ECO:0000313/EMBL:CCA69691.1} [Serendipita indica DSM 11827]CCA69691.1 hypothetical protein PIIN_03630 [Serendipita indica DSM 11827]